MESSDFNPFWDLESPRYPINRTHEPVRGASHFNPFDLLPDPLLSEMPLPPFPDSNEACASVLTEEDASHVDNLLFFGVDSPVLPLDILLACLAAAGMDQCLETMLTRPSDGPSASSASPSVSSALFSPTTTYVAPPRSPSAGERCYPLADPTEQPPLYNPSPSTPHPAKGPGTSYPGGSSFQLDPTIAPRPPSKPADQRTDNSCSRPKYYTCPCPAGRASNRARHWRACPYNPGGSVKCFQCGICGERFTREDNKKRHVEDKHG